MSPIDVNCQPFDSLSHFIDELSVQFSGNFSTQESPCYHALLAIGKMAANIDNPQGPVTGASKAPKSRHRHGLPTPEGTPAPEDARIAADKERSARETRQQGIMPPIAETPDGEEAQSKPAFDIGSRDDQESHSNSDSDESGDEDVSPPTDAQVEAVN